MYLKSLTVLGFKSFADKTTLNFLPGVTAIVGPNGCGKSNISDAIRWVLGEQSAKALRAGEMADVIFNGTDTRKPLGMAEVSLTIGDVDKDQLKAAGINLEYNEVTITRRVFRDGSSEYFINKIPCRLKDIQMLFAGTGVGKSSYSIIAQGNITQILSSKPEERRLVFEEAAGITRYKSQKKEALRKLEYTDQNLLRVSDLIKEVKRQIGSLQRQAGKARRYKQLSLELQHLETQYARHQFDVISSEISNLSNKAREIEEEIETRAGEIARLEDELVQLRQNLSEVERQAGELNQRSVELKAGIEQNENRINFNQNRLKELVEQNERTHFEITQGEERRRAAEEELAALRDRISAAEAAIVERRRVLEERRIALEGIEKELQRTQEMLRAAQSEAFGYAQQLARFRNEIVSIDAQRQGNGARLEKLVIEKQQLEQEQVQLNERLAQFSASVETQKQEAANRRLSVEECQKRLQEIQEQLKVVEQQMDGLMTRQASQRSRLNVLEQLEQAREGFSAAAAAILKQSREVLGSLADKIRVPDQYVVAIENALGANLQVILAEKPETAHKILNDLAESKKGRASVAALALRPMNGDEFEKQSSSPEQTSAAVAESGFAVRGEAENPSAGGDGGKVHALNVIQADPSVESLLRGLLGRTYIVPDLQTATAALMNGHSGCDFVTLKGELLNRYGIFTGGYSNGNGSAASPSSILGRKNQISALQEQLARLQSEIDNLSARRNELGAEQKAIVANLQDAQKQLRECELSIIQREGEQRALQNSIRLINQRIQNIDFDIQSLQRDLEQSLNRRMEIAAKVSQLEEQEQGASQKVVAFGGALEELRQKRDSANAALTEAKVALASEEQVYAGYNRQQGPLRQRIDELSQQIERRKNEISQIITRREQLQLEIEESQRAIEQLSEVRHQVNSDIARLMELKTRIESEISERENLLRSARAEHSALQQQRGNIEVELTQKRMSIQNLRERIYQKYQINLEDIRSECITITIADQGTAKVETLTPEEMQRRGLSTDWEAVASQIAALQKRIDEMGPVNLVAIEEYEETEQRYQFLSQQYDDLQKAKQQLLDVINRINAQTRDMFADTFNKIRENFQRIFVEVFGGGKADLRLVDEGDVLESGIEIVARPPGKQLQSISLLSGGEQAMTAISLLFSIYMVRPSPFCFLDELDAPLDENNINRFAKMLQRFINNSQFIIITHNKRTIALADVVYGVTMEERGVSKIVSMRFKDSGLRANRDIQNADSQSPHQQRQNSSDKNGEQHSGNGSAEEVVLVK
ncbi:MAG: chromosome segregation protein SMC [Verrucomicrobiia bacterium]